MTRYVLSGTKKILNDGSRETLAIEADVWEKYKRNALRYLRAGNMSHQAIATLEELPFSCEEIWLEDQFEGPFPSGDQILFLRVPVEVFVEIERESGNWNQRIAQGIPEVIHALNRMGCKIIGAVAEIELDAENQPIEILQSGELKITSATVEHALSQARTLIVSHGAPAALDRVHTVFHAYLKIACQKANVPMTNDRPGIEELLGLLRKYEVFVFDAELEELVTKTLRGAQKVVDALETFRNEHSLAHPQNMLPQPEALFVINVTQAMLRYIDSRLPD